MKEHNPKNLDVSACLTIASRNYFWLKGFIHGLSASARPVEAGVITEFDRALNLLDELFKYTEKLADELESKKQ